MCGFFAQFLSRPLQPRDHALGAAATAALAHRGPDGQGVWSDAPAGVFLGHRRLSIIDLSAASNQPFIADGWAIAFNGEIYNYQELRARLEATGRSFRTQGDTEVLLQAWRAGRERALDELEGMFAFALWNGREGFAATDPFGEKPLYYAQTPDGVYFSSEIGPLASALGIAPRLEGHTLTAFLATGCLPAPTTAYPGISRCAPATFITVRNGRVVQTRRYWEPRISSIQTGTPAPLSEKDLDRVEAALTQSVAERLVADVPVCAFLSSGVDSALLTALARNHLDRRLPCISVAFSTGRAHNEAPAAAAIAAHLDVPHEVLESGRAEAESIEAVLSLFGQPNDNVTILAVAAMSKLARTRFKVALTGMGGDELFFGYRKHESMYRHRRLLRVPGALRSAAGDFADGIRTLHPKLGGFADTIGVRDWELVAAQKNIGTIRWLRSLPGWQVWAREHFATGGTPLDRIAPQYDLMHTMPDAMLTAQDLGSMHHALEMRAPFLSRKVWALLSEFDPRALLAFGRKSVLYRLLARHLPAQLIDARKVGFSFPLDNVLRAHGTSLPKVHGLDPELAAWAWRKRTSGDSWLRLGMRLVIAERVSGASLGNAPSAALAAAG
jgi:asparagine synthase (glutamine-hydrolysing)